MDTTFQNEREYFYSKYTNNGIDQSTGEVKKTIKQEFVKIVRRAILDIFGTNAVPKTITKEQYDELASLIREKIDQKFSLVNSRGEETEPAE